MPDAKLPRPAAHKSRLLFFQIVEFENPPKVVLPLGPNGTTYMQELYESKAGLFQSNSVCDTYEDCSKQQWLYVGILVAVFVVFRTGACIILRAKATP